jgi:hypothetical protein
MSYSQCNSSTEDGAGESGSHPGQELGGHVRLGCNRIQLNLYMSHETNIDLRAPEPLWLSISSGGYTLSRYADWSYVVAMPSHIHRTAATECMISCIKIIRCTRLPHAYPIGQVEEIPKEASPTYRYDDNGYKYLWLSLP